MADVVTCPNVIHFRYNRPRAIAATTPTAAPAMQLAQLATARGIAYAEDELRRNGFDRDVAQHLARLTVLSFLSAFDGAPDPSGLVYDAVIDKCDREQWIRR